MVCMPDIRHRRVNCHTLNKYSWTHYPCQIWTAVIVALPAIMQNSLNLQSCMSNKKYMCNHVSVTCYINDLKQLNILSGCYIIFNFSYIEFYISLIFFTQMPHHLHFKDTALYDTVYDVKLRNNYYRKDTHRDLTGFRRRKYSLRTLKGALQNSH
jgi:hypothetical protein